MITRGSVLLVAVVAAAMVLAACSNTAGESATTATGATTSTTRATATTEATTATTAATTSTAGGTTTTTGATSTTGATTTTTQATTTTSGGGSAQVTIAGFAFSPGTLTVPVGTTVIWVNSDGITHTVTANGGAFNSGNLVDGAAFQFTFTQAGQFPYHCALHASMSGTITVTG